MIVKWEPCSCRQLVSFDVMGHIYLKFATRNNDHLELRIDQKLSQRCVIVSQKMGVSLPDIMEKLRKLYFMKSAKFHP